MTTILDDSPLHSLWTKAVGTEGYDKAEWGALQRKLHGALAEVRRLRAMRQADVKTPRYD